MDARPVRRVAVATTMVLALVLSACGSAPTVPAPSAAAPDSFERHASR